MKSRHEPGVKPVPSESVDRHYWRSPGQREGAPEIGGDGEFPEGASEPPDETSRRTMLKLIGASLSALGAAACRRPVENIVPFVTAPEEAIPGIPRRYATTMPQGLSSVGLVVESHEGRPTKIEGNPLHPASLGASSAWIQASLLGLYDPDRSKAVLHDGQPSDWDGLAAAWGELAPGLVQNAGSGLAVIGQSSSSPTLARLRAAFEKRFPNAIWATYDPVSDENSLEGIRRATGSAHQPFYDFSKARVVLSLDSDFLLTESDSVRHSAGFAEARRMRSTSDTMSRLYVAEGVHSLTGANADHRLVLRGSQVAQLTQLLVDELSRRDRSLGLPSARATTGLPEAAAGWAQQLAGELLAHRGASLILAGRRQPAEVHAAVAALNEALGNIGTTVHLRPLEDASVSSLSSLQRLTRAMGSGQVNTLVVLGGNPVYDAPVDLDFAAGLEQVANVIQLADRADESSPFASWHLPRTHYLESWGDARASDGTLSVVQPLIEPLFGGKSEVELLSLLVHDEFHSGHDLVRESWQANLTGDFESGWRRVLHDGLLRASGGSRPARIRPAAVQELRRVKGSASEPSAQQLEVVFRASPSVFDGRYANNGWLQELPDPITKLTWDNAALLSPSTADELGLSNSDVVRLTLGDRSLELPVLVTPGQAANTVVLDLGHGRSAAGRVGNGAGFNAYVLRTSQALHWQSGATIEGLGRKALLATTQDHQTLDQLGKDERDHRVPTLIREETIEHYREHPEFASHAAMAPHDPHSMWKEHEFTEGHQWGMTIDLNACIGCNACVVACQAENNIPVVGKDQVSRGREMHWLRVDRYFTGPEEEPQTRFQAVPCMHCENAPCEQVCPVSATVHDAEGLNVMVYNRCIGTRYCSNNCPYKVRRFNFYNFTKDTPEVQQLAQNPDVTVRSRGVMEKCTYCTQRINAAKIDAKLDGRELVDGDVTTACQQACPTRAIEFGDLQDAGSQVAAAKRQDRNYSMLEELYTKPRTTYLAKLRNPNPELEDA